MRTMTVINRHGDDITHYVYDCGCRINATSGKTAASCPSGDTNCEMQNPIDFEEFSIEGAEDVSVVPYASRLPFDLNKLPLTLLLLLFIIRGMKERA